MNVGRIIKYHGNINRIMEMHAEGLGAHGIAGTFRDNGIKIDAMQVQAIIDTHDALGAKALPKAAAKSHIRGVRAAFATA